MMRQRREHQEIVQYPILVYPIVRCKVNLIVLITKFYIFQQKCIGNKPTETGLMEELQSNYRYEKSLCFDHKKRTRCDIEWEPVLEFVPITINKMYVGPFVCPYKQPWNSLKRHRTGI